MRFTDAYEALHGYLPLFAVTQILFANCLAY